MLNSFMNSVQWRISWNHCWISINESRMADVRSDAAHNGAERTWGACQAHDGLDWSWDLQGLLVSGTIKTFKLRDYQRDQPQGHYLEEAIRTSEGFQAGYGSNANVAQIKCWGSLGKIQMKNAFQPAVMIIFFCPLLEKFCPLLENIDQSGTRLPRL